MPNAGSTSEPDRGSRRVHVPAGLVHKRTNSCPQKCQDRYTPYLERRTDLGDKPHAVHFRRRPRVDRGPIIHRVRVPGGVNSADLGWMSEQWLAGGANRVMEAEFKRLVMRSPFAVHVEKPKREGEATLLYPFDARVAWVAAYHKRGARCVNSASRRFSIGAHHG